MKLCRICIPGTAAGLPAPAQSAQAPPKGWMNKASLPRVAAFFALSTAMLGQSSATSGSAPSQAVTNYIRYVLMAIGGPEHDPAAEAKQEATFTAVWGLNSTEAALLHQAGQNFLAASQAALTQIMASPATAASASASLDQAVTSAATQLLNSVRPEVASRITKIASIAPPVKIPGGN
jgi:hypothetical protein